MCWESTEARFTKSVKTKPYSDVVMFRIEQINIFSRSVEDSRLTQH